MNDHEHCDAVLRDLGPVENDPLFGLIGLTSDDGPKPYGAVAVSADQYLADLVADEAPNEGDPPET